MKHIAVCIVSYRGVADVVSCLGALATSTHGEFTVVICENGGAEADRALDAVVPAALEGGQAIIRLSAPDNPGYAAGVNRCMAALPDADGWWVLNPDCEPAPDALAAMVARLGDADAVGGVVHHRDGWVQAYGGGQWRPALGRVDALGYGQPLSAPVAVADWEAKLDYLSGASCLVGKRFFERIGAMREDYFLYCEEIEWFVRAKNAGLRLALAADAHVMHLQGTATGSGGPMRTRGKLPIYLDMRNRVNVVRDTSPGLLAVTLASLFAQMPLIFGRRLAFRQWGYALAGLKAGARGERGKPDWIVR